MFLKESAPGSKTESPFFAGPDYYFFPYTKRTYSQDLAWDSNNEGTTQYVDWNWQDDYVAYYSSDNEKFKFERSLYANNKVCFK